MKIYESTQYVNPKEQTEPWYSLHVINQWDFITKPVCFREVSTQLISYYLVVNIPLDGDSYTSEVIQEITDEMKEQLNVMGYYPLRNKTL